MSVLILLIAAGGTVASGFLIAFVWAVRSGQFDDTCTPAVRMLLDARTVPGQSPDQPIPATRSHPTTGA
jgi:cbb3-type cytochrome oxidase maturation protein